MKVKRFSKTCQPNRRFPEKGHHWSSSINLSESFELFLWVDWVGSYKLSNVTKLIVIFKLYHSLWSNQYIFTCCHDWIDWFGMSRVQVWSRSQATSEFGEMRSLTQPRGEQLRHPALGGCPCRLGTFTPLSASLHSLAGKALGKNKGAPNWGKRPIIKA